MECGFFRRMKAFGTGRIHITTHELELRTTPQGDPRRCTRISWAQIARLCATGAPCVPWVEQTEGGMTLGVKEDPQGTPLPLGVLPPVKGAWEDPEHEDPPHLSPSEQDTMLAWFAHHGGLEEGAGREAILAVYTARGPDAWLWDMVVLDEQPLGAMRKVTHATLEDLNLWRASGDLSVKDDAAWRRLCDAMAQDDVLADAHLDAWFGDTGLSVRAEKSATGMDHLALALELDGQARMDVLHKAPDHHALLALGAATTRAFVDARIERGRLYLPHVRRFDTSQARCFVYLDATAHPGTIQAMFGPAMKRHALSVKLPQGLRVTQAAWSATKNLVGPKGTMHHDLDLKRLGACLEAFDSPGARWMMHQTWEPILGERVRDRGSYYGSARSRGVNEWEGAHTIVAGAHYVPRAELESCAKTLRWMAGELGGDLDQTDWGAAATWELVTGPMIQAVWRIRPLSATPSHPKHIVLLDGRQLPGLPPTEVLDLSALMVKTNQGVWGKGGWGEVVRGLLDASGGVFLPALADHNLRKTRIPRDPPSSLQGDLGEYASVPLTQWQAWAKGLAGHVEDHWGGWGQMAKELGLECKRLRTSSPGLPWVVLWDPEVPFDLGEVCRRCEERGLAWVEVDGTRIHVGGLWYIDAFAHLDEPPTPKNLAHVFGITPRSISRRLAQMGHTLDDVRKAYQGYQEAKKDEAKVPEASPGSEWALGQLLRAIRDIQHVRQLRPSDLAAHMGLSLGATTSWCRLLGYRHWEDVEEKWAMVQVALE